MPFPSQVNVVQAPAVAGDFADKNPRYTVDAGPGALVAGAAGVIAALFAWADPYNLTVSNSGAGAPTGFVGRNQQQIITQFLADNTMAVPAGLPVTVYSGGSFWVKNAGASASVIGQKAYANNSTGAVSFAASGAPTQGGSGSASTLALNTVATSTIAQPSFTATFSGTTMTVSAVGTGLVPIGATLAGTNVDPATTVMAQLSGTAGGAGTYQVSVSQTIAVGTTVTTPGTSIFTLGAVPTGYVANPGQTLSGTGVVAGTTVLQLQTGNANASGSTYSVTNSQTVASTTITASGGMLTVAGTVTGSFAVGDTIYGAGVTAGSAITAILSGTGGAGTYLVTVGQTLLAQAISAYANTETKWYAMSVGAPGELVKMSSQPLG